MIEVLRIGDLRGFDLPNGRKGHVLAFDLRDLLPLVTDEGSLLYWAAIPMGEGTEILGRGPRDEEAYALGAKVDATEKGVPLDWEDLNDLTSSILQTVWGTFVAFRDPTSFAEIPSLFNDDWRYLDRASVRFYDLVEIAFQAVDSAYWLVWAKHEVVRERIRGAFAAVETIPGESFYRPNGSA